MVIDDQQNEINFQEISPGTYTSITEFRARPGKKCFQQTYKENAAANDGRIPDFRSQLLWMPSLHLKEQEITIPFYTLYEGGRPVLHPGIL